MKYTIFAILWAVLIWMGSSIPGSALPGDLTIWSYGHIPEYVVLGYLLIRALLVRENRSALHTQKKELLFVFAVSVGILYGAVDEIHQWFVPYRNVDVLDLVFDACGVFIGAYVGYYRKI